MLNFVVDLYNFCGDDSDNVILILGLIVGGEICGSYFDFYGETVTSRYLKELERVRIGNSHFRKE